ncbi:MAG: tRNA (guanosine(37)-N1)-methyltransferase TrmD [Alphaproteobacteria bacterium]|nr:tRNA (guanosine(37)-N1)-methyltransferase TrmD [Alphaproteobacteria bacterium]
MKSNLVNNQPWLITLLTLFPEMFPGSLGHSLAGKALADGIWNYQTIDIRKHAINKHGTVDDKPYGGGTGMLMRPDAVGPAIDEALEHPMKPHLIYLTPRGKVFDQNLAYQLINRPHVAILCGRFEGIDARLLAEYPCEEISLGDFVLSGGEPAALCMLDACIRLLPGVIQSSEALGEESFVSSGQLSGLLEYPHYTRPPVWKDHPVPDVLVSGNHAAIAKWRLEQAQQITALRRPDLWQHYQEKQAGENKKNNENKKKK